MVRATLKSSNTLLALVLLIYTNELSCHAYVLPTSFPTLNYPKVRAPGYGSSMLDKGPSGRFQRLMQQVKQSQNPKEETEEHLKTLIKDVSETAQKSRRSNEAVYDSFLKFKPNRFAENSPEWNAAMIQYLLDMKKNGHKIKEIETSKALAELYKSLKDHQGLIYNNHLEVEDKSEVNLDNEESGNESAQEKDIKTDPIICKMEPFNVCYRVNSKGMMHALGDRRPVRLLRVYKKNNIK